MPLRILLCGDFGGQLTGHRTHVSDNAALRKVDADTFGDVLASVRPAVRLSVGEGQNPIALEFNDLEAFHPDRLVEDVPILAQLHRIRQRLQMPSTAADARAELAALDIPLPASESVSSEDAQPPETAGGGGPSDLDDLLNRSSAKKQSTQSDDTVNGAVDAFIRKALADNDDAPGEPVPNDAAAAAAQVEAATATMLRRILHSPEFQRVEAIWRGLDFLISRVDDESVEIFLIDIPQSRLGATLASGDRQEGRNELQQLMTDKAAGQADGSFWALIVGLYTFSGTDADLDCLTRRFLLGRGTQNFWVAGTSSNSVFPRAGTPRPMRNRPRGRHSGEALRRRMLPWPLPGFCCGCLMESAWNR